MGNTAKDNGNYSSILGLILGYDTYCKSAGNQGIYHAGIGIPSSMLALNPQHQEDHVLDASSAKAAGLDEDSARAATQRKRWEIWKLRSAIV